MLAGTRHELVASQDDSATLRWQLEQCYPEEYDRDDDDEEEDGWEDSGARGSNGALPTTSLPGLEGQRAQGVREGDDSVRANAVGVDSRTARISDQPPRLGADPDVAAQPGEAYRPPSWTDACGLPPR